MTSKLLPLTRVNNWEIEIYDSNDANPVNLASYCQEVIIQIDPANETGLYRQFVDLEFRQPVLTGSQTPVILRRNVGNLRSGNRIRIRYRKTDNTLVTVFDGRIYRFIEQGFKYIKLRAACLLSVLDNPKPAGNFANDSDPFGGTITAQECLNNIFTATGYGPIDFSNSTVSGSPTFPLNKPDGEGLVTQAGKFISQFSRNFLWHNPRTNTIQAYPMSLTGPPVRTFSDSESPFALIEYETNLDTATNKTAVTSVVTQKQLQGPAEYSVTTSFDGITITRSQTWPNDNTCVETVTIVTPLERLQDANTRERWGNPIGSGVKTITTTTNYVGDWISSKVTTEVGGVFHADANWVKDYDEFYNRNTWGNTTLRETIITYTHTDGNLKQLVTLEKIHDWIRAPVLPESRTPVYFTELRPERETHQMVRPVAGGYQIHNYTKRWEYDDFGPADRIVGDVDEPQFTEDPPQVTTKPLVSGGNYYKIGAQQYRGVYMGTNTDVNPFLDEIKELTAEYCDSEQKCVDYAELRHKLMVGQEEALSFEVDATDNLLESWRPWEIWRLTKFGVTANYVITEIGFYLTKNTASFRGRALKL